MTFEWDPRKARANLKKHRVDFDEAASVFLDPLATTYADLSRFISEAPGDYRRLYNQGESSVRVPLRARDANSDHQCAANTIGKPSQGPTSC